MEGVDSSLLSGDVVHVSLRTQALDAAVLVFSVSVGWSILIKCCHRLPDPLVDLRVQGEAVGDGGAEGRDLVNSIDLKVTDGWTLVFFRLMLVLGETVH